MSEVVETRGRRWRRAVAVLVLLGALAAAAALVFHRGPRDATREPAAGVRNDVSREAALTVTVVDLAPVELTRTLTVNGSIHAWQEVIIAPEVGGYRVAEVNVDVGDEVAQGQELVRLSSTLLTAEVETKQATLKQRQAELINAEAALKRAEALSSMDVFSEADLDQLSSEALAAQARLESARADLETSRLRLKFTSVTAPDDGVITARSVTVGQVAQAGNEMLRLMREGRIEWRGEVPEARLAELAPGQTVYVTTADDSEYTGRIRIVAPTVANANRTGLVYVDLPADSRLRPGMFARGEIEVGRRMGYTVPLQSVVNADGYSYVFVLQPDFTVERRRVETGGVKDTDIEILAGVESGESVVGEGAGFLKDGDLVNVVEDSKS